MRVVSETFDREARLSWVLAMLAGVLGATAFTHSEGYFVTFMTGNAQRAVLGYFRGDVVLSITAGVLLLCFVAGVVVASMWPGGFWAGYVPRHVPAAFLGGTCAWPDRVDDLQSGGRHTAGRYR